MPGPVSESYGGPKDPPIRTAEDFIAALGGAIEEGMLEGVLGLDDDGTVAGKRMLALVLDDEQQTRIRFSMATSPESPSEYSAAVGHTCHCAEIMVKDPLRHFRGCSRREELPAGHPHAEVPRG